MNIKTDVLVIGGGPDGAAAAMFLTREGIKPIVLEQETFPRFHIGESMTGDYEHEDDYSIPIGSRFHPERAAIWEPNSPLSTTEEWMLAHSS